LLRVSGLLPNYQPTLLANTRDDGITDCDCLYIRITLNMVTAKGAVRTASCHFTQDTGGHCNNLASTGSSRIDYSATCLHSRRKDF